ncbi:DUF4312 family protein [Carnobacterium divergens]|uniref:DUF4312 family protein n=1 Tax=Carnobacterium divergens TaxID=2748 RepID=UPI0007F464EC|nr:DUF4312 family protein [Carnobacterium divergens]SBO17220.1 Protein [Carnobacterium divergens]
MSEVRCKKRQVIRVEGTGKEKKQAFASALNRIHTKVLKESNEVVLRIESLDVQVLVAEEETFTEKFLFLFLPRTRVTYRVVLNVEIEVTLIEMEKVTFVQKKISDPNGVSNPFRKKKLIQKEES